MKTTKNILCLFVVGSILPVSISAQDNIDEPVLETTVKHSAAFREVNDGEVFTGISVIDAEELIKKNYTTSSMPDIKSLVSGWIGNNMWGMGECLILVDGIPRDTDDLTLSEISQIVFMKGAAAVVLYGSRASKGAVNIITKRGSYNEKLSVTASGSTGMYVPKSFPKYLSSAEYMTLYNEARANDGLSPLYTDEDIYHYGSGINPYKYPNLDYYSDDYLKKAYNRSNVALEFRGGTKRSRFYANVGYLRQGSLYKLGNAADSYKDRLNVRGNLDMSISEEVKAFANANVIFENNKAPRFQGDNFWTEATKIRPNQFSPFIPITMLDMNNSLANSLVNSDRVYDGFILGGSKINSTNSLADMYAAGYQNTTSRLFQFDTGVDFALDMLTKGLSFHFIFGVDYNTGYRTSVVNNYAVYEPVWLQTNGFDMVSSMNKYGTDKETSTLTLGNSSSDQTISMAAHFDYKRTFDKKHTVSAMFLANGYQQTLSGQYHKISNANLGIQFGYDYLKKYYFDFSSAVVYSAKFAKDNRAAFSPSLTLGWNLKKESFLENNSIVDDLTLGLSATVLNQDIDINGYYSYMQVFDNTSDKWYWYDGSSGEISKSKSGENKNLSFVKRKELAFNLRTSLFDKLLKADFNVFHTTIEGLPVEVESFVPSYLYYPGLSNSSFGYMINYESNRIAGFDYNIEVNKKIGEVETSFGLTGMYYKTKATRRDEINKFDYQNQEGKPLNMIKGYKCIGFFESEMDIENSPTQALGGTVKPGDLKYKDMNDDGVIDSNDMVYLEPKNSPYNLGLHMTLRWKNFTLFAAGNGNIGGYGLMDSSYYWVYGDRKYSEIVRGRWTEETKNTATYPRLTTQDGNNNFVSSSFWLYSTDQFNLSRVQLTYDFPKRTLGKSLIKGLSVYLGASDVLTIAKEKDILELNVGSAPQNRYYDFGVKFTF